MVGIGGGYRGSHLLPLLRLTEIGIQKSMCMNFLTFKVTAAPPRRKKFVAKPMKKDKKKCPRKLTDSGMPKV